MAALERVDCKDIVSVFATASWEMLKTFHVCTSDAVGISWSPDDRAIYVQDDCTTYKVAVYAPNGQFFAEHVAYTGKLGVKTVSWSPSSQFLAIGSYDGQLIFLNNISYKKVNRCRSELEAPNHAVN